MELQSPRPQTPILFFIFSLANVLGVLIAPALPDLQSYFQIGKASAQQTVAIYMLGGALGQFVYAPLSNAFGRKLALFIGLGISLFGSLICLISIYTHSFSWLLFGRMLTALGASCGVLITNTMLADTYTRAESNKILSYIMTVYAVFPSLGIVLSGYVTEYISWEGVFYIVLIYSVLVALLASLLPETGKNPHISHLNIKKIAASYVTQIKNLPFLLYATLTSCASIILQVFAAEAPFIAERNLDLSSASFGVHNLIPNIGLLIGGILAGRLAKRIAPNLGLILGVIFFSIASFAMWACFSLDWISTITLFGLPAIIFFSSPIILATGVSQATHISYDKSYASSVLYALQYVIGFVALSLLHLFPSSSVSVIPVLYSGAAVIMILLWILLQPLRKDLP